MGVGFVPLGNPRGNRNDPCRLCWQSDDLTKTHAPSKASGNRGHARPLGQKIAPDGSRVLSLGSGTPDSGSWGWWFCTSCNGATEPWETEYRRWQAAVLAGFEQHGSPLVPIELADHDPGAFVRAPWAWMFALDDALFGDHSELAAATRSGVAIEPPEDLRLWIAATASLHQWTSRQRGGYGINLDLRHGGWQQHGSGLWAVEPELVEMPRAVISAPPFVLVLSNSAHEVGLFDTSPWLTEDARNRRPVSLLLPTVDVRRRRDYTVRYEDIVVRQLQI